MSGSALFAGFSTNILIGMVAWNEAIHRNQPVALRQRGLPTGFG
jgi:hypothetical protein